MKKVINKRYWKCSKCGGLAWTEDQQGIKGDMPIICVRPAFFRTSGICCGRYIEIDNEEFEILKAKK